MVRSPFVQIPAGSDSFMQTKLKRLQTTLYEKHRFPTTLTMADGDNSSTSFAMISCAVSKGDLASNQHQAPSKATCTTSFMALSPKMRPAEMVAMKCWMPCAMASAVFTLTLIKGSRI